jgi:hypothetical protein
MDTEPEPEKKILTLSPTLIVLSCLFVFISIYEFATGYSPSGRLGNWHWVSAAEPMNNLILAMVFLSLGLIAKAFGR